MQAASGGPSALQQTAPHHALLPFLLLLLLLLLGPALGEVAYVSQNPVGNETTLANALKQENVSTIVLTSDVAAGDLEAYNGPGRQALPLTRNLTITSADPKNPRVLDMLLMRAALHLCSTCNLTLTHVAIANERKGNGGAIDFFTGDTGGFVVMQDAYGIRLACMPAGAGVKFAAATPPSPTHPTPQKSSIINATFRGVDYPDSWHSENASLRVEPSPMEGGGGHLGGYDVLYFNYTRLCKSEVDPACLANNVAEVCTAQAIDAMLRQEAPHQGSSAAAIIAPVVVGAVVLLAALGGFVIWRRRHRRRKKRRAAAAATYADDVEAALRAGGHPGSAQEGQSIMGSGNWKLVHFQSYTPPLTLEPQQQEQEQQEQQQQQKGGPHSGARDLSCLQLGELLGAGSFGKVFRSQWHGEAVAVKVIEHGRGVDVSGVQNEGRLLLSIDHPNVVKCYAFATFVWAPEGARKKPARSSAPTVQVQTSASSDTARGQRDQHSSNSGSDGTAGTASGQAQSHGRAVEQRRVLLQGPTGGLEASGASRSRSGAGARQAPDQQQQQQQADQESRQLPAPASAPHPGAPPAGSGTASVGLQQPGSSGAGSSATHQASSSSGNPTSGSGKASDPWPLLEGPRGSHSSSSEGMGTTERDPMAAVTRTMIVQEYCNGGTLFGMVEQLRRDLDLPPEEYLVGLAGLLADAARGLHHVHARQIVHGDFNGHNCLISGRADPSGTSSSQVVAKVSDFGLSRNITGTHRTTQTVGTISHMPPERLITGRLSPAGDVYAFGIMMWELWTGQSAWQGLHFGQVCQQVAVADARPPALDAAPAAYTQLMTDCWVRDAAARPSMAQVLARVEEMLDLFRDPEVAANLD